MSSLFTHTRASIFLRFFAISFPFQEKLYELNFDDIELVVVENAVRRYNHLIIHIVEYLAGQFYRVGDRLFPVEILFIEC